MIRTSPEELEWVNLDLVGPFFLPIRLWLTKPDVSNIMLLRQPVLDIQVPTFKNEVSS